MFLKSPMAMIQQVLPKFRQFCKVFEERHGVEIMSPYLGSGMVWTSPARCRGMS